MCADVVQSPHQFTAINELDSELLSLGYGGRIEASRGSDHAVLTGKPVPEERSAELADLIDPNIPGRPPFALDNAPFVPPPQPEINVAVRFAVSARLRDIPPFKAKQLSNDLLKFPRGESTQTGRLLELLAPEPSFDHWNQPGEEEDRCEQNADRVETQHPDGVNVQQQRQRDSPGAVNARREQDDERRGQPTDKSDEPIIKSGRRPSSIGSRNSLVINEHGSVSAEPTRF